MKVTSLVMLGQPVNVTPLMGMTLMTKPTLVRRARRMMVTTPPPHPTQVSTVNLCVCVFMCVNGHVVWAVSVSGLLQLIFLLVHIACHACSCHMSVFSHALMMARHTPCECCVHVWSTQYLHLLCILCVPLQQMPCLIWRERGERPQVSVMWLFSIAVVCFHTVSTCYFTTSISSLYLTIAPPSNLDSTVALVLCMCTPTPMHARTHAHMHTHTHHLSVLVCVHVVLLVCHHLLSAVCAVS